MAPKHPTSPPYKSSLVVSRSKETEKHMTTVPKPVAHSRWNTWLIKILEKNVLKWFPVGYEDIIEHLFMQWKDISKKTLKNIDQKSRKMVYVHYNPKMDIEDLKAWSIQIEDQTGIETPSGWSWKYDPPESRYLLHLIRKEIEEQIKSDEGLLKIRELVKSCVGLILANSYQL